MALSPIGYLITFCYTNNLSQTAEFYEKVLGLPLLRDQGDCRIYAIGDNGALGFCQREDAPEEPAGLILTFVTPDVDKWHARLRDEGVTFQKAPTQNEKYGIYHFMARDPNGYVIEFQRFVKPLRGRGEG